MAGSSSKWTRLFFLLIPIYLVLVVWALVELYPILFMFQTALKTDAEIVGNVWALPIRPHFENFVQAWRGGSLGVPISRYFLNSVIVVFGTLFLLTLTGTLAAYALSRYDFPGNRFLQRLSRCFIFLDDSVCAIPTPG
jgi:N-acetylglucosamine transport system permease protein